MHLSESCQLLSSTSLLPFLLGPLLTLLPLPAPLLPLLLLGGLAPARHDAVQHQLVALGAPCVRLHQRLQLVPHDAVLLVPREGGGGGGDSRNVVVTNVLVSMTVDFILVLSTKWFG